MVVYVHEERLVATLHQEVCEEDRIVEKAVAAVLVRRRVMPGVGCHSGWEVGGLATHGSERAPARVPPAAQDEEGYKKFCDEE